MSTRATSSEASSVPDSNQFTDRTMNLDKQPLNEQISHVASILDSQDALISTLQQHLQILQVGIAIAVIWTLLF